MKFRTVVDYDLVLSAVMTCALAAHMEETEALRYRMDAAVETDPSRIDRLLARAKEYEERAAAYRERGTLLEKDALANAFVDEAAA